MNSNYMYTRSKWNNDQNINFTLSANKNKNHKSPSDGTWFVWATSGETFYYVYESLRIFEVHYLYIIK